MMKFYSETLCEFSLDFRLLFCIVVSAQIFCLNKTHVEMQAILHFLPYFVLGQFFLISFVLFLCLLLINLSRNEEPLRRTSLRLLLFSLDSTNSQETKRLIFLLLLREVFVSRYLSWVLRSLTLLRESLLR